MKWKLYNSWNMPVFSHSRSDADGQVIGSKLLIDHLYDVRKKAFGNLHHNLKISDNDTLERILEAVCLLHDFGKFTVYFQNYLFRRPGVDPLLKRHSSLGASLAYRVFEEHNPEAGLISFFLIRMHHGNVINFDAAIWPPDVNEYLEQEIFQKQLAALAGFQQLQVAFPEVNFLTFKLATHTELFKAYKKFLKKNPSVKRYFLVNYLFSLLIEADKLDASGAALYSRKKINASSVSKRKGFGNPFVPAGPLHEYSQNELRNYVRLQVLKKLELPEILNKRMFTLTAPTGIGKTMTSLDFVLRLREKIQSAEGYLPQIIYGLPFINIIEQALDEYRKTLIGGKVIAHYQYADLFGEEKNSGNWDDQNQRYQKTIMEWDTWQSDVVITTFVQFFETLIGNRNKLLKKFHHYAGSIILLDEVQTLALEKLPVVGAALYNLAKYLDARILIMTATQPKIFEVMEKVLEVTISEKDLLPIHLLGNSSEVFECFNRTCLLPHLGEKIDNEGFVEFFKEQWSARKNYLVVLNKVGRSVEIFELLREWAAENNIRMFYLSTNITPWQRHHTIQQIKEALHDKNCILVSTQVVEAGVDLDFDIGYRDIGPIDSIVQVAGRINRENSAERLNAPLFIFDFDDCMRIYGPVTYFQAKKSLSDSSEIPEKNYKELVEKYFDEITREGKNDFSYSREIFSAMKSLKYGERESKQGMRSAGRTVSDFQIIEKKDFGVAVFVEAPGDEAATLAREKYQALLRGEILRDEFDTNYKLDFHQRIITVPKYLAKTRELSLGEKISDNLLWIQPSEFDLYYNDETGFLRQEIAGDPVVMF